MLNQEDFKRTYKIKTYLNGRHYIYIDGMKGQLHPHSWEFVLYIDYPRDEFIPFSEFEKELKVYLEPYSNKILNETSPFDIIVPTLENIAEYFAASFYEIIEKLGGKLTVIEASETPTRTVIVDVDKIIAPKKEADYFENNLKNKLIKNRLKHISNLN